MIKYTLECKCKKTFESWFSTSAEYDSLKKRKLINCIYCNSTSVKKSLMAPQLFSKSNQDPKKTKIARKIRNQLLDVRKYIENNCKNVGTNFAQEARNIHYDKKTGQGIYGSATPKEAEELLDEGIDVATIPWVNKLEN